MPFNINKIRQDFPLLSRKISGRDLIYLDNAATTQKPNVVIEAMAKFYREYNANIHRGVYKLSEQATEAYEQARGDVARFINAKPEEIIFTRNATESINLVAWTWGKQNIAKGAAILITEMEHHANFVPWQQLAKQTGAELRFIKIDDKGRLDIRNLNKLLEGVKLVALTHMSNVLGTINPVKEIIAAAHKKGVLALVDASQSIAHLPIDVSGMDCDFLGFSGHKMLGPTGVGVLYAKHELLKSMPPFIMGGDMIKEVTRDSTVFNDPPHKFEAGTPNIAGAIGLAAAIKYLQTVGIKNTAKYEAELTKYSLKRLAEVKSVKIKGPTDFQDRGPAISFTFEGLHPHDLASILDEYGICIRAGHHCAMPLHQKLGLSATARVSLYFYNTREEVDTLVQALQEIEKKLQHSMDRLKAKARKPAAAMAVK